MGCPIRILKALRSHAAPLERFAGLRVLHRPSVPRHPPRTLCSLFLFVVIFAFRSSSLVGAWKDVPLLLLLLYGKIEERNDFSCKCASCQFSRRPLNRLNSLSG